MMYFSLEKSMPPVIQPIGGMMMSLTSDVTILPNAAPMTTATARSTTLPRMMNALKSLAKLIAYSLCWKWASASPAASRRVHLGTTAHRAQAAAHSGNMSFQHGDAFQLGAKAVAAHQWPDACRGAGENQVAGPEFEQLRQLRDDLRHGEDHVRDVGVLARFAIDRERKVRMRRVSDVAGRAQRRNRRGSVEALGDIPRQALGFHRRLQVAAGQIQAHAVAKYAVQCVACIDFAPALRQRNHHLHFVMQVVR